MKVDSPEGITQNDQMQKKELTDGRGGTLRGCKGVIRRDWEMFMCE